MTEINDYVFKNLTNAAKDLILSLIKQIGDSNTRNAEEISSILFIVSLMSSAIGKSISSKENISINNANEFIETYIPTLKSKLGALDSIH